MTEYTLAVQIAAVRREIALRERVYPRLIASARMKPEKSVFEIGAMRAVLESLCRLEGLEKWALDLDPEGTPEEMRQMLEEWAKL